MRPSQVILPLFVPVVPGVREAIDAGSGIVGCYRENWLGGGPRTEIWFEGNRYGASNILTFADRVAMAAGRMAENAPTIAHLWVEPDDVLCVGWWHGFEGEVHLDGPRGTEVLAAWLGVETIDPAQLLSTDARRTNLRTVRAAMAEGHPDAPRMAAWFATTFGHDPNP